MGKILDFTGVFPCFGLWGASADFWGQGIPGFAAAIDLELRENRKDLLYAKE